MMFSCIRPLFAAFAVLAAATLPGQAQTAKQPARSAQANQGPSNALQGFSKNRDEPVQIEAASLEVRDKDKIATFTGNEADDLMLRREAAVDYFDGETGPSKET